MQSEVLNSKKLLASLFRETFDREGENLIAPRSQGTFDVTSEDGKVYTLEFLHGVGEEIFLNDEDLQFDAQPGLSFEPPHFRY